LDCLTRCDRLLPDDHEALNPGALAMTERERKGLRQISARACKKRIHAFLFPFVVCCCDKTDYCSPTKAPTCFVADNLIVGQGNPRNRDNLGLPWEHPRRGDFSAKEVLHKNIGDLLFA